MIFLLDFFFSPRPIDRMGVIDRLGGHLAARQGQPTTGTILHPSSFVLWDTERQVLVNDTKQYSIFTTGSHSANSS